MGPLESSELYNTESKALIGSKNPQAQSSNGSSEATKGKNDADFEPKETARGVENQKKQEKIKEKEFDESEFLLTIDKLRANELENVKQFGNFELSKNFGLYFSGSII